MLNEFDNMKIYNMLDVEDASGNIEKLIRNSREYRAYLSYCKDSLNMRYSASYPNLDFVENNISLEIHHIIQLYDLVNIVGHELLSHLKVGEYILSYDIAKAVIMLHMNDMIPVMSLSITEHQLETEHILYFENMKYPDDNSYMNKIHMGNFNEFLKVYGNYISVAYPQYITFYKNHGVNYEQN